MIATRYSVALHIMLLVARDGGGESTSAKLAWSIGTNPVVVRRIAGLLSRAGLIAVQRGPGGASLARPAEEISLRDIWRAIHPEEDRLLGLHGKTNPACAVGSRVPALLRRRFEAAEAAMLEDLRGTTLAALSRQLDTPAERQQSAAD